MIKLLSDNYHNLKALVDGKVFNIGGSAKVVLHVDGSGLIRDIEINIKTYGK